MDITPFGFLDSIVILKRKQYNKHKISTNANFKSNCDNELGTMRIPKMWVGPEEEEEGFTARLVYTLDFFTLRGTRVEGEEGPYRGTEVRPDRETHLIL